MWGHRAGKRNGAVERGCSVGCFWWCYSFYNMIEIISVQFFWSWPSWLIRYCKSILVQTNELTRLTSYYSYMFFLHEIMSPPSKICCLAGGFRYVSCSPRKKNWFAGRCSHFDSSLRTLQTPSRSSNRRIHGPKNPIPILIGLIRGNPSRTLYPDIPNDGSLGLASWVYFHPYGIFGLF